ncbi:uncharacterized protein PAC_19701 [Phialocephala subalpina]|uniref:Serine protease n=1 Tax=Phialocephala subalpina TaxID=576137 RepID=A0A1L7XXK7_9HELO|nr:uncharacterized protein PAC_19701 [Phialocephala subalpina]
MAAMKRATHPFTWELMSWRDLSSQPIRADMDWKKCMEITRRTCNKRGTERRPVPKAVFWKSTIHNAEAILGKNTRDAVPSREVAPYGDYRSIVKIRATFPNGKTLGGSAVVIIGHTVLTACHNIYNEEHGGPAQIITVIAGMDGTSGSPEVQHGKYAVAHYSWCANGAVKNDLGLVRLEKPFTTLEPKEYHQNLYSEKEKVYGYSGDIPVFAKGTQLYVSLSLATYHPLDTAGSVEHEADTFNGNSGGPILGEDGKVFAIHRGSGRNGSGKKINQAVAINREGNDVADFVAVLDQIDTNGFDGKGEWFGTW